MSSETGFGDVSLADEENTVCFIDGQLSCMELSWESIPPGVTAEYGECATRVDLNFNCLSCLDGMERFTRLEALNLDNNNLTDEFTIPKLPYLHTLTLNKNKLKDLDGLLDKVEASLPKVTYLSLLGNEACPNQLSSAEKDDDDYRRYRYYVLYRLPKLRFLDSSPVSDVERNEARRQGPFLKIVRPNEDLLKSTDEDNNSDNYTPLPRTLREEPDHSASFGKCRYVYYGRHSEGNRFIRNNDL